MDELRIERLVTNFLKRFDSILTIGRLAMDGFEYTNTRALKKFLCSRQRFIGFSSIYALSHGLVTVFDVSFERRQQIAFLRSQRN